MNASVRSKSIVGMLWVACEKCSTQVLRFGIGIVLARLLTPNDYGMVGMLAVFIALSDLFVDSGFGLALIQKKDRTEEDYSTVFFFNLAMSVVAYLVLFAAAPMIASFYRMPDLCNLCRVMSLGLPLGALCTIQRTRMTINLDFKSQTGISIASLLVSGLVGIGMAYKGWGVWALVWQGIAASVTNIALLWGVARWCPQMAFSMSLFKRFFSFGWKHLCTCFISVVYDNVYTLVIGKSFGAADLGHFTRAYGYPTLAANTVSDTVLKVNFPILSQFQDDHAKLVSVYRKMLRAPMFLLIPLLLGMAVTARPLIVTMIGEKWLPCVPYLQVMCVAMIFYPLSNVNLNLLYVKGRTDIVLKLDLIKKPIAFAIVFCAIPFGILGMCFSKVIYSMIAFAFNCYYTKKLLGYGLLDQLKDIAFLLLNSMVMVGVVFLVMRLFDANWMKLLVGVSAGIAVYVLMALLTKDQSFMALLELRK